MGSRAMLDFVRVAIGGMASCVLPLTVVGAQVPLRTLPKPEVEYREAFTAISGLRELKDGRVLVADAREKTLQVIDLARGTAMAVGRTGAGPGEWGTPTTLHALPGDSTLMLDYANQRIFLVAPDGKPAPSQRFPDGAMFSADLIGIDGSGRMLMKQSRRPSGPTDPSVGVADVIVVNRSTGRADTLASLSEPKGEHMAARVLPGGMMQWSTNLPLAARDLAAIASDGRVAIVRAAPYRVEWIAPNGARVMGPVAQPPSIPVTRAEKEAFARSQLRPGGIIVAGPSGTPPSAKGSPSPRPRVPAMSKSDLEKMMSPDQRWPDVKPPFLENAVQVAPDGKVWVLRARAHDDPVPTFDIFDAGGRVVERVALPAGTRLAGFGKGALYLARTDSDDLVWLQRVRR